MILVGILYYFSMFLSSLLNKNIEKGFEDLDKFDFDWFLNSSIEEFRKHLQNESVISWSNDDTFLNGCACKNNIPALGQEIYSCTSNRSRESFL